jgi:hypothetical protein
LTTVNAVNEAYSYDPWGNMQQSGDFSFTQQFTAQNQIQGYSYDPGGRGALLNDGVGNDYVYNADGLLVQATSSDGTGFAYDYDAEGPPGADP